MHIYVENDEERIIRVRVKKGEEAEARDYVKRLRKLPSIKLAIFEDHPELVNCEFSDELSRRVFLPL